MRYSYLGKSGLLVSQVCLGTMTFGQTTWGTDNKTSWEILDTFFDLGGNFVDTADKYSETRSESIIGKWLSTKDRDDIVLATKCFFPTGNGPNDRGLSSKHIISACEQSLKRLDTDYIDLYQIHAPDPNVDIYETIRTLDTLIKQGKVRYIGLSNFPAWQVVRAHFTAMQSGLDKFVSGQYLYNLLKRDIESEVIPACIEYGLGILCWSPLSGGMLTGKYVDGDFLPPETRLSNRSEISKDRYRQWLEKSSTVLQEVISIAERRNVPPASISLAWLLGKVGISSVIVGASKSEQITANCKCASLDLQPDEMTILNQASSRSLGYPENWLESTYKEVFNRDLQFRV